MTALRETRRGAGSAQRVGKIVGASLGRAGIAIAAILVIWELMLWIFQIPAFVGRGPLDVLAYFTSAPEAAANRSSAAGLLGTTLGDAAVGFVFGLALALVIAALFILVRSVENALLPIALLLQSIPLITLAPILILILGRGSATVAAMGAVVVLFPALVTITFGLRSAPQQALDLVAVSGGGSLQSLFRVSIPYSIPALFAAVRISVPGAITGALIVEWLATGKGIGNAIIAAVGASQIDVVWALAVLISLVTLLLYQFVAIIESAVVARLGFTS